MSVIVGAGHVGNFAPGAVVLLSWRTPVALAGAWSGLVCAVKGDGSASEAGCSLSLDQPVSGVAAAPLSAPGNHLAVVDTGGQDAGGFYTPGDYRVLLFGDDIAGENCQGVCVGQFSIADRS